MSRYAIPAKDAALEVTVGWDNPLQTYFAQVAVQDSQAEDDGPLYWFGTAWQAIGTVEALAAQIHPWALLPAELGDLLRQDQQAGTPPTLLQYQMAHLFQDKLP